MANPGTTSSKSFLQFIAAPFSDVSVDKAGGFLRGNLFFLLWILVVPMLMFGVKQGWELLYGLFDDVGPYPGFRAAAMLFIYYLLAMAIWLLPLPFFRKINPDTPEGLSNFNKLRRVTAGNPYRGLMVSALPMIFYSIAMIGAPWQINKEKSEEKNQNKRNYYGQVNQNVGFSIGTVFGHFLEFISKDKVICFYTKNQMKYFSRTSF